MNIQKRTVTSASRPPKPPANSAKPRPKTSNSFKKVDEKSLETMVNEYGDGMLKMNREKEKKKEEDTPKADQDYENDFEDTDKTKKTRKFKSITRKKSPVKKVVISKPDSSLDIVKRKSLIEPKQNDTKTKPRTRSQSASKTKSNDHTPNDSLRENSFSSVSTQRSRKKELLSAYKPSAASKPQIRKGFATTQPQKVERQFYENPIGNMHNSNPDLFVDGSHLSQQDVRLIRMKRILSQGHADVLEVKVPNFYANSSVQSRLDHLYSNLLEGNIMQKENISYKLMKSFKKDVDRYLRQWERNEKFNYSHQDILEPYYDESNLGDNYTNSFSCYNTSSGKRHNSVRYQSESQQFELPAPQNTVRNSISVPNKKDCNEENPSPFIEPFFYLNK